MNGGVIIIGSLLWADSLNKNDSIRKNWRKSRLDINNAIRVKLPIRYGRRSKDGEFTMVFSTRLEKTSKLGIGYVIPFRKNPINSYSQLEKEADKMALAEGLGTNQHPRFYTSWGGALGLLFNKKKVDKRQMNLLTINWKKRYLLDKRNYDEKNFGAKGERKSIKDGMLQIKWPDCIDKRDNSILDNLDFLIAASNKPRYSNGIPVIYKYPKITELAKLNLKDTKRFYFLKNVKNGILTFQDLQILNKMKQAH